MFISIDLHKFEKLLEIVDYEIVVSERIEQRLLQVLEIVNQNDEYHADFIKQQIFFSQELSRELREKQELLVQILEIFCKSKTNTSDVINDSLTMLKKLDTI